jgi:hypothetical protein
MGDTGTKRSYIHSPSVEAKGSDSRLEKGTFRILYSVEDLEFFLWEHISFAFCDKYLYMQLITMQFAFAWCN